MGSCLFLMKEIIGSLQESRSYWANCYHTHIFDNYHTTQSPTESMNRSIKQMDIYMGSKSLHNSASTMIRQSEQLEKRREQWVQYISEQNVLKFDILYWKMIVYGTFCFKMRYWSSHFWHCATYVCLCAKSVAESTPSQWIVHWNGVSLPRAISWPNTQKVWRSLCLMSGKTSWGSAFLAIHLGL